MSNRKQHLLTIALVLLVVASCFLEQVNARKHRGSSKKSHSRRPKGVNIEIYHPKGVMIWYPYRPGMELFGIEIFINRANQARDESEGLSEESVPSCDICLNTTAISYGKFILRSDDAIIRSRDHVYYNAIVKKATGEAYISRSNDFYVSDSRILKVDIAAGHKDYNDSLPAIETRLANLSTIELDRLREVALLEEILSDLNQQCYGEQNQTRQLLLNVQTPTRYDAKGLYQFVSRTLATKLPTIEWNRTLVDAYYAGNSIAFEVTTIVDKLKILKLAKALPDQPIADLDLFQTEDMSNDIESWATE